MIRNNRLLLNEVTDPLRPKIIASSSTVPLFFDTELTPEIEIAGVPNGVNLTFTYRNTTARALAMGKIGLGGLELGRRVWIYDFTKGSVEYLRDMGLHGDGPSGQWWAGHSSPGAAYDYPDDLFSPVSVLRGEGTGLRIALSVLYPVLEYQQRIGFQVNREFGDPRSDVTLWLRGELSPGATRSYTLALRVVRESDSWVRALIPYRNYFRTHYGAVSFARDPRPVYAAITSFLSLVGPSDPYGYTFDFGERPDLFGWRPWSNLILGQRAMGFDRAMMWAPTGLYNPHGGVDYNIPQLFMTPMLSRPLMRDTMNELLRIPRAGMQMGYYQGYASQIHSSWDDPQPVALDLNNPDHLARGFREFDTAMALEPSYIGLDAITLTPLWDALRWTDMLQARAPRHINFLGEASPSDIWLTRYAGFVFDSQAPGPDILADFITPGHEIWSGINFQEVFPNQFVTNDMMLQEMRLVASEGHVPVPFSSVIMPNRQDYRAARSWEVTIPTDLRDPCQ